MSHHAFTFAGHLCHALASGALSVPDAGVLCVSDLHLGKSERIARRGGTLLPPYENRATLEKLDAACAQTGATTIICLGDSFDDLTAADALEPEVTDWLLRLQAGRRWIWIEGNHDAGPTALGGSHLASFALGALSFRHIATPATPEISGHYHPKCSVPGTTARRACFVYDEKRLILPAFGTYTGGMSVSDPAIIGLFSPRAIVVATGRTALPIPLSATRPLSRSRGRFS